MSREIDRIVPEKRYYEGKSSAGNRTITCNGGQHVAWEVYKLDFNLEMMSYERLDTHTVPHWAVRLDDPDFKKRRIDSVGILYRTDKLQDGLEDALDQVCNQAGCQGGHNCIKKRG